jgi:DNA-binding MarR family transcriptional regulator
MHGIKKKDINREKPERLDGQMIVVREFISELYDKTLFREEVNLSSDLPPSQIKSLSAFRDENKAYAIGELRKNARVKRSTISVMVDRLERDGIAERFREDGDRRIVKVRLTEKGKKIRREFSQKMRREMEKVFSKLTVNERSTLLEYLTGACNILRKI